MSKEIEEVITSVLKSSVQKNALSFIVHLRGDEGVSILMDDNDEGRWWIKDKNNLLFANLTWDLQIQKRIHWVV